MNKLNIVLIAMLALIGMSMTACKKDFLDAKPSRSMVVPSSLADFQGMLDDATILNSSGLGLAEMMVDDIYAPNTVYLSVSPAEQGFYIWEDDPEFPKYDWIRGYEKIFKVNVVLDQVKEFTPSNDQEVAWQNSIQGTALFYRSQSYLELLQLFSLPYKRSTAATDMGVILVLKGDVQFRAPRSSVEDSYQQVVKDLKQAIRLLPEEVQYKTRPNKAAAYGMLARCFLFMEDYAQAYMYADSALLQYDVLLDYNTLQKPNPNSNPFARFHDEVIYSSELVSNALYSGSRGGFVDTLLYASYEPDDLRKELFFFVQNGLAQLTGTYAGQVRLLSGIATDELFLIRAEAHARLGRIGEAMDDLNRLLITRWKTGTYVSFAASNETEALRIILTERRKQLLKRGIRWSDIRRLNQDSRFSITLERRLNGETYTLPPGDLRFAVLLPNSELFYNPLVQQNPR